MNFIKKFWKYCLILIIWTFIAISIALIEYDNKDLSASVLSLTEQDFFKSKKWDAWYKKENQVFELFLSEKVRENPKIEVSIIYSPNEFELNIDNLTSQFQINNTQINKWNVIFSVQWYNNADFSEWIFQIPYSGENKKINLEYVKYNDYIYSIWNLDNIETTTNH